MNKWDDAINAEQGAHTPRLIYVEAQARVREAVMKEFPIDLGVTTKCGVKYTGKPGGCYTVAIAEHVLRVTDDVAQYLLRTFVQGKPQLVFAKMDHGVVTNCCVYEL